MTIRLCVLVAFVWAISVAAQRPLHLPGNNLDTSFLEGGHGTIPGLVDSLMKIERVQDEWPGDKDVSHMKEWEGAAENIASVSDFLKEHETVDRRQLEGTCLGVAYFMTGRFSDAVATYRKVIALGPAKPSVYFNLVLADVKLGKLPDARTDLQAGRQARTQPVVDFTPLGKFLDDVEAAARHIQAANAFLGQGKYLEASHESIEAAKLHRDNPVPFEMIAFAQGRDPRLGDPAKSYELAAEVSAPNDPFPHVGLASIACGKKDWSVSEREFQAALRIAPGAIDTRISHAMCLNGQGKSDASVAEWKEALRLGPNDKRVLNSYGYQLADHGEHLDEALAMIQRAVNADPKNADYLDSLGWAYFKMHKLPEAVRYLTEAAAGSPDSQDTREHLAQARKAAAALPATPAEQWVARMRAAYTAHDQKTVIDMADTGAAAAPGLSLALHDSDGSLRLLATMMIARIGPAAANTAPDLAFALDAAWSDAKAAPQYREMLGKAIVALGPAAIVPILAGPPIDHGAYYGPATTALATIGKPAIPVLVECLKKSTLAPHAAETLGKMGPEAAEAIRQVQR